VADRLVENRESAHGILQGSINLHVAVAPAVSNRNAFSSARVIGFRAKKWTWILKFFWIFLLAPNLFSGNNLGQFLRRACQFFHQIIAS
jgi:hypothetical protein